MVLRSDLFPLPPSGEDIEWKHAHFLDSMHTLTQHHQRHCPSYRNILSVLGFSPDITCPIEKLPFLPADIFRYVHMSSIAGHEIKRTLASSGTTGRPVSKVHLDVTTSARQMLALSLIVADFIPAQRLPILILDSPAVIEGKDSSYVGRAAGVQGFSALGRGRTFALTNEMRINISEIDRFLKLVDGGPFLIYGFTYVVWTYFYEILEKDGVFFDFSQGIMIHGGGWKRLVDQQVSDDVFRLRSYSLLGLTHVHNYYGMVEQAGSIYMQCERSFFHCSSFSEVFIRRSRDFSLCATGEPGIIQTMSIVPCSYPGHNILTEDEGILIGEDDCMCGRPGKYFLVNGRLKDVKLKGCGDVSFFTHT